MFTVDLHFTLDKYCLLFVLFFICLYFNASAFVFLGVTETETGTETVRTAPETGTGIGTETGIGTGTETGTETETQNFPVAQRTAHRPYQLCLLLSR